MFLPIPMESFQRTQFLEFCNPSWTFSSIEYKGPKSCFELLGVKWAQPDIIELTWKGKKERPFVWQPCLVPRWVTWVGVQSSSTRWQTCCTMSKQRWMGDAAPPGRDSTTHTHTHTHTQFNIAIQSVHTMQTGVSSTNAIKGSCVQTNSWNLEWSLERI